MRKRVALAQTMISEPQILLMDEPFSALDVQTRNLMEDQLLDLWALTSASVVFVTRDLEEAIAPADRVVVMTAGPATASSGVRHPTGRARRRCRPARPAAAQRRRAAGGLACAP
jgi:NitT/TauT family transport system ATP-binding protein